MTRRRVPVRHARRTHSHSLGRTVAIAVAAVAGFSTVWAQTLAIQFGGAISQRDANPLVTSIPDSPVEVAGSRPLNILLMGSDVRSGDNAQIGGDVANGMRNDTTIIAHLAGDRSRIDFMSIPRDLQVDVPDCTLFDGTTVAGGRRDFNAAFANGGLQGDPAEAAACAINTVHATMGIRIDHWAVIDFVGFTRMVDALGGVPICIPERIVSTKANLDLEAGPQVLDGKDALGYARLRTAEVGSVSGSDLQRINRQQDLLNQTARTAFAKNLLTDAPELTSFLRAGAESLTTDQDLGDLDFMVRLAYGLRGLSSQALTFTTVPWEYTEDRMSVLMTDDAPRMFDDIRHDRPISVRPQDDSTSEWDSFPTDPDGMPSPAPDTTHGAPGDSIDDVLATCGP
ncbi:MAG: LCP family protein [Demequina sp.]